MAPEPPEEPVEAPVVLPDEPVALAPLTPEAPLSPEAPADAPADPEFAPASGWAPEESVDDEHALAIAATAPHATHPAVIERRILQVRS